MRRLGLLLLIPPLALAGDFITGGGATDKVDRYTRPLSIPETQWIGGDALNDIKAHECGYGGASPFINAKCAQPPYASGAKGDGTTDDAPAIRAAIAATGGHGTVFLPPGDYRIASSLVLDGNVSMLGNGTARLLYDVDPSGYLGQANNRVIIHFGRDTSWTGKFTGVNVRQNGSYFSEGLMALALRNALDFEISGGVFDNIKGPAGCFLGAQFYGPYQGGSTPLLVKRGKILRNSIIFQADNTGSEATSMTFTSEDILYEGNTFIGMGDDALAIHGSKKIRAIGNYIETKIGRILVESGASGTVVSNNVLVKKGTLTAGQGSSGINVSMGYDSPDYIVKDTVITGNLVMNEDTMNDLVYPIVISGANGVTVANNVLVNKRGAGQFTFRLSAAQFGANTYHNKNVMIAGNYVKGGSFDISNARFDGAPPAPGAAGPMVVHDNVADGEGWVSMPMYLNLQTSRQESGWNNQGFNGASSNVRENGDGFAGGTTLGSFSAANVTYGGNMKLAGTNMEALFVAGKTRIKRIDVSFSAPTANDGTLSVLASNGATDTVIGVAGIPAGRRSASIFIFDVFNVWAPDLPPAAAGSAYKIGLGSTAGFGGVDAFATLVAEPAPFDVPSTSLPLVFPDDAQTQSHVYFTASGIADRYGLAWQQQGTVPIVAAGAKYEAGPFSSADFFKLAANSDGIDFPAGMSGCAVVDLTGAVAFDTIFANGIESTAGYTVRLQGVVRFNNAYGGGNDVAYQGGVTTPGVNVICFGRDATKSYVSVNGAASYSCTSTSVVAGTGYRATIGEVSTGGSGPLAHGYIRELWLSGTPWDEARMTAIGTAALAASR